MIQINTLYSLEFVKGFYYVTDDLKVINILDNTEKSLSINKGGYPYVTLETVEYRNVKVPLHKIVALAFIHNGPYELIEHIDDNKMNWSIDNLRFSNKRANMLSAFKNGKVNRLESIFCLVFDDYIEVGSMWEIAQNTNIPRGTLYDIYYNKRFDTNRRGIRNIFITGRQTVKSRNNA